MPVTYASPGVYVEEVEKGTKPIEAVGTSIAAFVGISAEASRKAIQPDGSVEVVESVVNKPILVTNWTQYVETFGGFVEGAYMPDAVYGYFNNGGGACYVLSLRGLNETAAPEEPADDAKADPKKTTSKAAASKAAASKAAAKPPELTVADFVGDSAQRTGFGALEPIDEISLLLCPDVMHGYDGSKKSKEFVKGVQTAMITHCELMRYRFAILDTPPGLNAQQAQEWRNYVNFDTAYAAMYYPWIQIANLGGGDGMSKMVPPSGHMVGIYNRSDAERGVHKAPANEVIRGAIGLEFQVSRGEQDVLNPIGVNCIRSFPGRGIRIWGARTLSSNGAWRYINVRRLFNMIGDSLDSRFAMGCVRAK